MARLPRLAVAGLPHLVTQQGRGAQPVFVDDMDRRLYLDALIVAARSCAVGVHAYALVDDEVCLLVTPDRADALGRFMQRIGRAYVPAFNRRHAKQGALWSGRFQATALDPEHYLLASIRFIEQAPVRAGTVTRAQDWPWSSAAHHVGLHSSPWITEHPAYWRIGNTPFEREAKHDIELRQLLSEAQLSEFREATRRGWPLGPSAFVTALAQLIDRPVQAPRRGRPRRPIE